MVTNHIYNEDCVSGMKKYIPDECIDLVVTSPPYDNLRAYNGYTFDFENTAKELFRVVKPCGVVVWIVGDATIKGSETGTSFKQALFFKEIGFNLHDTMIYYKDNPVPIGGNNRYYQAFEYIFVLSKGAPKTFNPITEPHRNKHNDKRLTRTKGFQRAADGSFIPKEVGVNHENPKHRNVFCYSLGASDHTQHPAVFPQKLAEDMIISYSNQGELVLDPFMGSGTTAKMCLETGRNYIGFEISKEYCKIISDRLGENVSKLW